MNELSILIIGAGAIGSYIGGSLALNGQRVVFLERPESAASLATDGFRIVTNEHKEFAIHPNLATNIVDAIHAGPYDAALVAVKSYDTQAVAQQLAPYRDQLPPIVCMQNGVENEAVLGAALGNDRIIAGTLTSAIAKSAPGYIVVERLRGLGLTGGHPVSQKLAAGFSRAGLNARLFPNAADMKWSKLLTNILANATAAILDLPPANIYANPGLFYLERLQFMEALSVMGKLGAKVVNLPGVPVKTLVQLMAGFPAWLARPIAVRFLGRGRGGKMPSFHIDLYAGNPRTEVDYLNGAVVRAGDRVGVEAPVNRLLNQTLSRIVRKEIPIEQFRHQPNKLLVMV